MSDWIKWEGGECPVGKAVRVDVITQRDTAIHNRMAADFNWSFYVKAYRLHDPSNEDKVSYWHKEGDGIEQLLTKANKHAKKAAKHEQKRLALIEQAKELLPEGYELNVLGEVVEAEAVEDMSDPNNWKKGDVVECIHNCGPYYTKGRNYTLMCWPSSKEVLHGEGDVTARDNDGDQYHAKASNFKWISRPNKETN